MAGLVRSIVLVLLRAVTSVVLVPRNLFNSQRCLRLRPSDDKALTNLRRNGYHVFGDRLDPETTVSLMQDFDEHVGVNLSTESRGQSTGRYFVEGEVLSPITDPIERRFYNLATEYFGSETVIRELSYYQYSKVEANRDDVPGGSYHVDDNKPNLKFFVYLTDVDAESGPFVYCPNTHGIWGWRRVFHWWMHQILPLRWLHYGAGGWSYPMRELDSIATPIVGVAGTIFVADTTGFHRASPVRAGNRKIFVASYRLGKVPLLE